MLNFFLKRLFHLLYLLLDKLWFFYLYFFFFNFLLLQQIFFCIHLDNVSDNFFICRFIMFGRCCKMGSILKDFVMVILVGLLDGGFLFFWCRLRL